VIGTRRIEPSKQSWGGTIVAIGGGEMRKLETLPIDREIVRLGAKRRPRALLVPTASGDSEGYWETFRAVYGDKLGCRTDVLWTLKKIPSEVEMAAKILASDIIYVGGGNTSKMMRAWRKLGIDRMLLQAHESGIVVSGLSAGSICWFKWGQSDSRKSAAAGRPWAHIRVRGLGLIPAAHCPHYHSEEGRQDFPSMVAEYGGVGIALDDTCALICRDDHYDILSARKGAHAYRLYRRSGEVVTEVITGSGSIRELCRSPRARRS